MKWKGTRGTRWGFHRKFSVGPELGKVGGYVVGNLNGTQLGYVLWVSVGNFGMYPSSVMLEEMWLENVRVMCSGHQMEDWLGNH